MADRRLTGEVRDRGNRYLDLLDELRVLLPTAASQDEMLLNLWGQLAALVPAEHEQEFDRLAALVELGYAGRVEVAWYEALGSDTFRPTNHL